MRKKKTGRMTKIVLLISFIILVGRLLYAFIVAIPHHQEKRAASEQQTQQAHTDNQ
ncbi:YfgG family protein [Serratia aquatilis]|uniref:YfgG family protein n=1 Tax=Serratia aquatilis TaxID=1737515 RepID=A0ABV6E893_9GAMM